MKTQFIIAGYARALNKMVAFGKITNEGYDDYYSFAFENAITKSIRKSLEID